MICEASFKICVRLHVSLDGYLIAHLYNMCKWSCTWSEVAFDLIKKKIVHVKWAEINA